MAPTSTPRVGSSSIITFGFVVSHFPSTTFCWLPPESVETGERGECVWIRSSEIVRVRDRELLARSGRPQPGDAGGRGHHQVLEYGHLQHQALPLSIRRDEGDAVPHGLLRLAVADGTTGDLDGALRLAQAEDRLHQLAAPGADEPGEPDDLARGDVEVDRVERARKRKAANLERELGRRALTLPLVHDILERVADHQLDQTGPVELGQRPLADRVAVAQDGGAVAELEDLAQPVRDEDHGHALLAQPADDPEERLDLVVGERARRLVEDENARVDRESARDLDHLLLVGPQAPHRQRRVEVEAEAGERLAARAGACRASR